MGAIAALSLIALLILLGWVMFGTGNMDENQRVTIMVIGITMIGIVIIVPSVARARRV